MYKNILVPIMLDDGGHEASFELTRTLADEGAKVTIIHVVEDIPDFVTAEIRQDVLDKSYETAKEKLGKAAAELPGASAVLLHGHAARTIDTYAKEHSIDCIVIASHKLGFTDIFIGSTASRVVRHAPCSVHVIR
ncbi:universal stress protein [Octadecabacter sp. 1_MG-2023]|uniref:universal stress protein n=1 Tax=unclassified Octadecabacter TaxID=196158 RepID=UPI001C07FEB2|nr:MULTISPECIES: universal stress protein [unclassified Octadecabacter]MBU2992418.1 universal stress protein [Octadecabacter sp. B2R22]MDO6734825.1 universal stress protein [Octadecabacter sp. 1_MG-2023]